MVVASLITSRPFLFPTASRLPPLRLRADTPLPPPEDDDALFANLELTPDAHVPEPPVPQVRGPSAPPMMGQRAGTGDATPPKTGLMQHPLPQVVLCAIGYMVHVCVLSRRSVNLGSVALGWDTAFGVAVLGAAASWRGRQQRPPIPQWLVRGDESAMEGENEARTMLDNSKEPAKERTKMLATCGMLLAAPLLFSYVSGPIELILYALVVIGVPLNDVRMMSARLILDQTLLYLLLGKLVHVRHPTFFTRKWVRWSWRGPWLLPVLGGYSASVALFNLVEPINQALLPSLDYLPEGIVAKLANPTDKSAASLALAAVAPCVGAPLFEELQSRAFILQALTSTMSLRNALLLMGFFFGAQHLQVGLVLPLAVTGFFWGVLYVNSRNLLVPILVHALWNGRIFLGSFLGL
jgi:membrane protease YdiL (CAAX protease family)